jgi:2-polyprenyl-3-methyl-5-hydroxy-6-metoxy-1,4-benzoquinol methylase
MNAFGDAFAPRRHRGVELLDDPSADGALAVRTLRDVARSNQWFGGTRAVIAELRPVIAAAARGEALSLLDVGTGAGDIPERARRVARAAGVRLETMGVELTPALAEASRARAGGAVAGSGLALPFADRSIDIVTCSQLLHHFEGAEARRLLAEMQRVARRRVVVADLRRAWFAAIGFWVASWPLGFHRVTRHDGVVSVLRGFRARELAALVLEATGRSAAVRNRAGFRVTAAWSPAGGASGAAR